MASLLEELGGAFNANTIAQLSSSLGTDQSGVASAIGAAVPALVGALADNTAQPSGANALLGALTGGGHNGSVLGQLASGALQNIDIADGAKILGHVLGGQQNDVASAVAKNSGLDMGTVMKLLPILAPIVLGMLGKRQQQQQMDAGGLGGLLQGERANLPGQGGLADILGSLTGAKAEPPKPRNPLDQDGDGDVDIMDAAAGLLKNQGGLGGALGKMFGAN